VKTRQLYKEDHLLMLSAYQTPTMHRHLAMHLLFAINGELCCKVGAQEFLAKAVCIASDEEHTAFSAKGEMLVFLFDETSLCAKRLKELFLGNIGYAVLNGALAGKIVSLWKEWGSDLEVFDQKALEACGISEGTAVVYDERIREVLLFMRQLDTIPSDVMALLCRKACLSQSRLSHLFKENAGVALNRYLVLEKMRKAYEYYQAFGNITEACMRAGFDSPSHYAATCKRMFGISFSEVEKSMR